MLDHAQSLRHNDQSQTVHPDALGELPTGVSELGVRTSSGFSITSVLLVDGIAAVADLPSEPSDRPSVYCPFCGRQGKYRKRRKATVYTEHFAHHEGQECVPADLANQLHSRAIRALVHCLAALREHGLRG